MFPSSYTTNDDYVLLKRDFTDAFICLVPLHDTKRHNSSSHNILARTVENLVEANTSGEELNEWVKVDLFESEAVAWSGTPGKGTLHRNCPDNFGLTIKGNSASLIRFLWFLDLRFHRHLHSPRNLPLRISLPVGC